MKLNDFSAGNASQRHHLTFQISTKSCQDMNLQKLAEFLHFFPSSFRKGVKVAIKHKGIIRLS